jgi:hypothetical protein
LLDHGIINISKNKMVKSDRFEMNDLGLVNLLAGGNNSSKTSVLGAIYLLTGYFSDFQTSAIPAIPIRPRNQKRSRRTRAAIPHPMPARLRIAVPKYKNASIIMPA